MTEHLPPPIKGSKKHLHLLVGGRKDSTEFRQWCKNMGCAADKAESEFQLSYLVRPLACCKLLSHDKHP